MKKRNNKKGFALVETLICAVFVCTVFMLLIVNYYPMLGKLQRYQNYDESENKYIAYHLSMLIKNNSSIFNNAPNTVFKNDRELYKLTIFKSNELCNQFNADKTRQCETFLADANISRVYYTTYSIEDLKTNISDSSLQELSRAFELYVKYMPTHKETANRIDEGENRTRNEKYVRIIIEREVKDTKDENEKVVYKYANVQVEVGE